MAWNRSSAESGVRSAKKQSAPSSAKGILIGLAIAVPLVALCLWLFSGGDDAPKAKPDKERGRIKEVTPAAAPKVEPEKPKEPVDPRVDYKPEDVYRDKFGILRYKRSGARAFDPKAPLRKSTVVRDREKETFHYQSERCIHRLLVQRPGERGFFGRIDYNSPEFLADFEKSLKEPIIIKEDELEFYKKRKRAMIEVKADICARMQAGEKLGDILTEAKNELQRLNEYKRNIESQINEVVSKGDLSDADIDDYIKAANIMLEQNGVTPVTKDQFVEWNIRLSAKGGAEGGADAEQQPAGNLEVNSENNNERNE